MALEHQFSCPLTNGVHARPASALEEVAREFVSEATVVNGRTGAAANAKSVLSLVATDIRHGDPCVLKVSGPDEQEAMAALTRFVRDKFPHCDDALPEPAAPAGGMRLPPSLRNSGVTVRNGLAVVPGVAQGKVVQIGRFSIPKKLLTETVSDPAAEWKKLNRALKQLIGSYDGRLEQAERGIESELLKALRSILRDVEFTRALHEAVMGRGRTAAGAVADAEAHFTAMLEASGNALLRERALDVQDVCFQLLLQVYGRLIGSGSIQLGPDSIVVAESLTPSQFLALERRHLKGLVLAQAGTTSHTVILARSFSIPTVTGVAGLAGADLSGQEAIVDANLGTLVTDITDPARRYYAMEHRRLESRQRRFWQSAMRPAETQDGRRIGVGANIATAEEAPRAFSSGAEGIGLFRTEMLFLDRDAAPGEEEQFECYRRVLAAADGRPVAIRTLDIGGDKPLEYLRLPKEENPFLGCRSIRIYPGFEALFRTQVRALIRASAHGRLKVMLPMVSTVEEARWVKGIIGEERARCQGEGVPFDAAMQMGAMVEVPAAVLSLEGLCRELDFFSIGSNDLLQYFMAADRANTRVARYNDPLQPAFLRFLAQAVREIRARNKPVSLCGEMGAQPRLLPLLVGLELDELSVALPAIAGVKAGLAGLATGDCRQLAASAIACATVSEVGQLLDQFAARRSLPLLDPGLVIVNADAASKEEAIKLAVDQLYVMGRTERPHAVEEAVWVREEAYSTGFGQGFAIPHCKTDAMHFNSLAVVKLRSPVEWGSVDNLPVSVVILLAVREGDASTQHMKVLSRLARLLMHDDFRGQLEKENDAAAICSFLEKSIEN
jgi:phosphoenolpyruvate-protein phosphotransferase